MLVANNKNIGEIDKVSEEYHKVISIDLQGNRLETLGAIKQFKELKELNLEDNMINDVNVLIESLKPLNHLEELTITGNPLSVHNLNWRYKVIDRLKQLRVLNSEEITEDDREEAKSKIERERELLSQLKEKYIKLKAAREVLKRLNLRKDMGVGKGKHLPSIDSLMDKAIKRIPLEVDMDLNQELKVKKLLEK